MVIVNVINIIFSITISYACSVLSSTLTASTNTQKGCKLALGSRSISDEGTEDQGSWQPCRGHTSKSNVRPRILMKAYCLLRLKPSFGFKWKQDTKSSSPAWSCPDMAGSMATEMQGATIEYSLAIYHGVQGFTAVISSHPYSCIAGTVLIITSIKAEP